MQSSAGQSPTHERSASENAKLTVLARLYPEMRVAGFPRNDQHVVFFTQVNALLQQHMMVLDFGAGRGSSMEWPVRFKQDLLNLKGKCAKVIGFDVDPAVRSNPLLDEAVVGEIGATLPFADAQFDLVVSRATFEHIADPGLYAQELGRVLKPGGWLCAWTPNRWGIVGIAANLVPNRIHAKMLRYFEPTRLDRDVFPTTYLMNTANALRRLFPEPSYLHASYSFSGPPAYHGNRLWLARFWQFYEFLMPPACRRILHIFIQKKS